MDEMMSETAFDARLNVLWVETWNATTARK